MIKFGVVQVGKTPSALSGKSSTKIEDEEALCGKEKLVKVANVFSGKKENGSDKKEKTEEKI